MGTNLGNVHTIYRSAILYGNSKTLACRVLNLKALEVDGR